MKFEDILVINGNELNKKYVESLNLEEREELVDPIFRKIREVGLIFPFDRSKVKKEWKRLCDKEFDLNEMSIFNNSNVATYICRAFCPEKFYGVGEIRGGEKTQSVIDVFNDDKLLEKVIRNRLGMFWYKKKGEHDVEAFPISMRQIIQGIRSARLSIATSMFKPDVAKFIYMKYSESGDKVYDYSMGFGGRLLGAIACDREYIGVDPLTSNDLIRMKDYFRDEFNIHFNCSLNNGVSEEFCLEEESVDLCFSSPPYFNQECYSTDETQAYIKGEDYFYNEYWKGTLENCHKMLKSGKYFIVNVKNFPKMVEMAGDYFEHWETVNLRTVRSHLTKKAGVEKNEGCFVFKKR